MASDEEIFGNLPDLTLLPSFTLDDPTFNDSFAPSIEPIPEMISQVKSKRKYEVWTEEEHRSFLEGLQKYMKGKTSKIWKKISKEFVVSKTPSQVRSHAQKFFQRQKIEVGKRLRPSINDITQY